MAREFNGSNQLLQVAAAPVTDYPFTVAGWSYPTDVTSGSADKYIFSIADDSVTTRYASLLWTDTALAPLRVAVVSGGAVRAYNTTATVSLNSWQHVAGVFTSATDIVGFLNADSAGAYTATGSPALSGLNRTSFGALRRSSTVAYYYGRLAELGVWNVALTQAEIDQLAAGYSPLMIRPQSLVAYWPLLGRASGEEDWIGSSGLTNTNGATIADHPRILYPSRKLWIPVSAGGAPTLTVPDSAHTHTLDNVVLTSSTALVVQDMAHGHALDAPTLSTDATLAVADSLHSHALDNVTLSTTGSVSLTVADLMHAHALDNVGLTSEAYLAVADMLHAHALDGVTVTLGGTTLTIADLLHSHALDNTALTLDTYLVVADALHSHALDNVTLSIPGGTIDLILKILANRQELNATTGTFTLYDDDSATILYQVNAWADAAGTVPYSGGTLARIDRLQ